MGRSFKTLITIALVRLRRAARCLVAFLLVSQVAIPSAVNASPSNVAAAVDTGVVRVFAKTPKGYSGGTGFVVSLDGHVVTNAHVVSKAQRVVVVLKQESTKPEIVPVEILWRSSELDLALLRATKSIGTPLKLSEAIPPKGAQVLTVGYPGVADASLDLSEKSFSESTMTQGIVGRVITASWSDGGRKLDVVQHSAAVNTGNSGGPLLDLCGNVVGVNTAKALGEVERAPGGVGVAVNQSDGIFFASHSALLIKVLAEQGLSPAIVQDQCRETSGQTGVAVSMQSSTTIALALAVFVLFVLVAALYRKKSSVVTETYTQFLRRGGEKIPEVPLKQPSLRLYSVASDIAKVDIRISVNALKRRPVTLGRDPSQNDHAIIDPTVSRRHARLSWESNRIYIEDLGSRNGTYIGKERLLGKHLLSAGTRSLCLGSVTLSVEWE